MVPDLETARRIGEMDETAQASLTSIQRPIVLLPWKRPGEIADQVAPRNHYLGVFLPYTPLHHVLFAHGRFSALVMTSGNLSEEPIAIGNGEALLRLGSLADFFLLHNRDILLRCDDSVVRVQGRTVRQMRRSRGFVPVPVFLKEEVLSVLAVGGELKNTICLTQGKHAFLSQHIGDLENVEALQFFHEAVEHLERILEIQPEIIAYDLHPDYLSTKWALQQAGKKLVGVQHHHAHIASCMAENHLEGRVIGVALDGTGYGTDGRIWGGEVLLADYRGFTREAHFDYVPLPGGEAAIREPWRMAVSYLWKHFGREFLNLPIPFVAGLDRRKTEVLVRMMDQNVSSPLTSSCGRLFDAVAALIGIRPQVNYEAQAAIELEMALEMTLKTPMESSAGKHDEYPLELVPEAGGLIIATRPMFEQLIQDLATALPTGVLSRRFHNSLVHVFVEVSSRLREKTGIDRVCLSGGTFNNMYLSEQLEARLRGAGFEVFVQRDVPCGDGGLSLGQAMVAAHSGTDSVESHLKK